MDFQPPAPAVARSLRLSAADPAATVTIRSEDAKQPGVVALTVAVLRPDLFRIVVESPGFRARRSARRARRAAGHMPSRAGSLTANGYL